MLADVDDLESGQAAAAAGAAAVATTLAGYTGGEVPDGPDVELVAALHGAVGVPVVAEGRYATPDDLHAAFGAGAHAVVVGTAITDPMALTRRLATATPAGSAGVSARSGDGASALPRRLAGGSPKGAQLREILEGLTGSLAPGSALPSERELADRYGVARMTVRTELDRLTADGLAYRIQGRGTFVAEPRVAQAMALTSFTEDMRTRGLRPSAQLLVRDEHEAGEAMARRLQLRPGSPVVRVDRLRLADDEPLAVEQVTLSLERFPEAATADLEATSLFELLEDRWGARPAEADQRVLAVAVLDADATLLGVDEGHPGLRFETLTRDGEGRPLFFAVSLFRGDRYEIDLRQVRIGPEEAP